MDRTEAIREIWRLKHEIEEIKDNWWNMNRKWISIQEASVMKVPTESTRIRQGIIDYLMNKFDLSKSDVIE